MAKGNAVLKISGVLLALFGILSVLWALTYGFLGAREFAEGPQHVLTGLLMFYGFWGVMVGLFQIGTSALCIRQANVPEHWLRCIIWGVVCLIIGIVSLMALLSTAGMIDKGSEFYPQWFGFAIVIVGEVVVPLLVILGGVLNKISHSGSESRKDAEDAEEEPESGAAADVLTVSASES